MVEKIFIAICVSAGLIQVLNVGKFCIMSEEKHRCVQMFLDGLSTMLYENFESTNECLMLSMNNVFRRRIKKDHHNQGLFVNYAYWHDASLGYPEI